MSGCHRDTVIIYYNAFFFSVILMMGSLLKWWHSKPRIWISQPAGLFLCVSFCVKAEGTDSSAHSGIKSNSSYLQHQVSYIQSEWKGQGSRHPQAGRGKVLHTRSRIHAPLVPISAHLLCTNTRHQTTKHLRSGIREEGYRTGPGNLCTNKQNQETTGGTMRDDGR